MAQNRTNFRCTILSPQNLIFEDDVNSLFIIGDRSEYELLAYHYPLVGLIQKGDIIIDAKRRISIRSGILRFFANECTILIEDTEHTFASGRRSLDEVIKL
ncbi:MAG: hypothetical protein HY209_05360 [Candidatus Omnitrophica bacterium]|nr:hypothetical protein [Candidatus Omnitrophota bacterium]